VTTPLQEVQDGLRREQSKYELFSDDFLLVLRAEQIDEHVVGTSPQYRCLQMAAFLANLKGHNASLKNLFPDDSNDKKLSMLPDEKDRVFDVDLGILMLNGYSTPCPQYPSIPIP
jgi:hypothetical protein